MNVKVEGWLHATGVYTYFTYAQVMRRVRSPNTHPACGISLTREASEDHAALLHNENAAAAPAAQLWSHGGKMESNLPLVLGLIN